MDYFKDPEFQELIRDYLDYLKDLFPTFKENCKKRDYLEIRKFGHNLKGSGGGYGFDDLTKLGGEISLAARNEDNAKLDSIVTELENLISNKCSEYFN